MTSLFTRKVRQENICFPYNIHGTIYNSDIRILLETGDKISLLPDIILKIKELNIQPCDNFVYNANGEICLGTTCHS